MGERLAALEIIAGLLLLLIGFGFHFLGQGLSLLNWELAQRLGLQERNMPREYQDYERGMAAADVALGWSYGLIGVGLVTGAAWAAKAASIPGAILTYHSLCFWFWSQRQRRAGYQGMSDALRRAWTLANLGTGVLLVATALFAWAA